MLGKISAPMKRIFESRLSVELSVSFLKKEQYAAILISV